MLEDGHSGGKDVGTEGFGCGRVLRSDPLTSAASHSFAGFSTGGVRDQPSPTIDHDHPPAHAPRLTMARRWSAGRPGRGGFRSRSGHDVRLAPGLAAHLGVDPGAPPPGRAEGDERQQQDIGQRQERL